MEATTILKNLYLDKCRFKGQHKIDLKIYDGAKIDQNYLQEFIKRSAMDQLLNLAIKEKPDCVQKTVNDLIAEYKIELFIFTRDEMVKLVESIKDVIKRYG